MSDADLMAEFGGDHAITGHHIRDDRVGGIVTGVRHQDAGALPGLFRGRVDGLVVSPLDPNHMPALPFDAPGAQRRNACGQKNPRLRPGALCRGGDRKPVIAIAGAEQRRQIWRRTGNKTGNVAAAGAGQRAQPGIGAAEGFEAAERPTAFVLGENLRDPESGRQTRQIEQRRRGIGRRQAQQFRRNRVRALRPVRTIIHQVSAV